MPRTPAESLLQTTGPAPEAATHPSGQDVSVSPPPGNDPAAAPTTADCPTRPPEQDRPVPPATRHVAGTPRLPAHGKPPAAPPEPAARPPGREPQPASAPGRAARLTEHGTPFAPGPEGDSPPGREGSARPAAKATGAEGPRGDGSATAAGSAPAGGAAPRRRGPADPVRAVMHRHHDLISTAVDPWEIAAGLEARGVTDGDAHRLRHRDVFGLAEELAARVPRAVRPVRPGPFAREPIALGGRDALLHLLPGLVTTAAAALRLPPAAAVAALVASTWPALRTGPLRARRATGWAAGAVLLLALARCGPHPVGTATLAVLALAVLPAAYLARWFASSARAQLAPSHGLADFADAVRPRLAGALAGYAVALLALSAAFGTFRGSALGALLFAARLLAVHGRARTAACGLAAACAAQALCLAVLPPGPAEAAACGAAALALAVHALRVLPHAAVHRA